MFTGIITEIGEVLDITRTNDAVILTVAARGTLADVTPGVSIAVDGVCLTVTEFTDAKFSADVMAETLRVTTLGALRIGDPVNLERAMAASDRFEGHIVQGHVDGRAKLTKITEGERWSDFSFVLPTELGRYLVSKGSIALNGTSLTLTHVEDGADETSTNRDGVTTFGVSLIPTTLAETTLGSLRVGDEVNVEVDVLAKYVERLMK